MVTSMPIPLNEENLGLLSGEVTVPCYDRSKLTPRNAVMPRLGEEPLEDCDDRFGLSLVTVR